MPLISLALWFSTYQISVSWLPTCMPPGKSSELLDVVLVEAVETVEIDSLDVLVDVVVLNVFEVEVDVEVEVD